MNNGKFRVQEGNGCWTVSGGKEIVACANEAGEVIGLEEGGQNCRFYLIRTEEDSERNEFRAEYTTEAWVMSDAVRSREDGFYEVTRTWKNSSSVPREASFRFELATRYEPTFTLIPCVSYDGNRWGTGGEPKGFGCEGEPWVFAYDRTGIPSATFSEDEEHAVGLFVTDSDDRSLRSACSMDMKAGQIVHKLFWPEREGPKSYIDRDRYGPGFIETVTLQPGESFRVNLYLSISAVKEPNTGWFQAYDRAAGLLLRDSSPIYSYDRIWELSIRYAEEWLLQAGTDEPRFEIGYLPGGSHSLQGRRGLKWERRAAHRTEIGWCGQNAALALALIKHGLGRGQPAAKVMGTRVLDTWARHAPRSNGLFRVTLDDPAEDCQIETVDVCNLAWGAWQFLSAYDCLKSVGEEKLSWLNIGVRLCDFFVRNFDPAYGFGHSWTLEGSPAARTGTSGAFLLLPLLKAYSLSGQADFFECARKAFDLYARRDLDRMQCTAGALDTDCIDKETCWPLLRSALDLYELTGEARYLGDAEKAGYYLLSWTYLYDARYEPDSDFIRYGYRTYGATSVSTQHHHLDPWGALIAPEWMRLGQHSGNPRWVAYAEAAWNNSLLGMSDGDTVIHEMSRPIGSQNEAFFHCRWNPDGGEAGRGSMNDWLVAWPTAFRLTALMEIDALGFYGNPSSF